MCIREHVCVRVYVCVCLSLFRGAFRETVCLLLPCMAGFPYRMCTGRDWVGIVCAGQAALVVTLFPNSDGSPFPPFEAGFLQKSLSEMLNNKLRVACKSGVICQGQKRCMMTMMQAKQATELPGVGLNARRAMGWLVDSRQRLHLIGRAHPRRFPQR